MTLEASRLMEAATLSFGPGGDVEVSDSGSYVLVPSVSTRVADVPAFLESLRTDPASADATLAVLADAVKADIDSAFATGAAGIAYWIEGASPSDFTPMQYGGLFLELDRDILDAVRDKGEAIVFVADRDEAYIDFVSDLPADLFGWVGASPEPAEIRALRPGRLLADHPTADVRLIGSVPARRAR